MLTFVDISVQRAAEAHDERRQRSPGARDFEAHAAAAVGERRAGADQAFALSHVLSSSIEATVASGDHSANPSAWCAPYETASDAAPALRASARSCVVSPIMRVSTGATPQRS